MSKFRTRINVYELLKNQIKYLDLKPGEKIVEAELSQLYGVSRTPIREALKKLEEENFIDIYPQRGTYVSKIDYNLVQQITYMRHVLEKDIFSRLCMDKTPVSSVTDEHLLMMQHALNIQDYRAFIKSDEKFHKAIFTIAGYENIWNIVSIHLSHYTRILILDMMMPDNIQASFESHRQIVHCIETGDIQGLDDIMEVHHDHKLSGLHEQIKVEHMEYFL